MKVTKRGALKTGGVLLAILLFYFGVLCFPQPFFAHSVTERNITLYSDRPFDPEAGRRVIRVARLKLATSPFFSEQKHHRVFVCNARWRQRIFFSYVYGVGGVSHYPLTDNVFLRDSLIEQNRLISPMGSQVPGARTLDYFVAHEITHTLTGKAVGPIQFHRLPQWVREGYADYVGRHGTFNYDQSRQAFLNDEREMDYQKSGLYLRFNLLVTYLIEKKGWSAQQVLEDRVPQQTVEDEIRHEAPRR